MAISEFPFSLVALHGEYDDQRRKELQSQLEPAHSAPMALLDMRDVTSIDASALAELIHLKECMPKLAIIRMIGLTPNVRRLLSVTGLDTLFEIHDSLRSAVVIASAQS